MSFSSARELCQNLVALAIQRCRISKNPCNLSILLEPSVESNPSLHRISISDTGSGSNLNEFKCIGFEKIHTSGGLWGGALSITTTALDDEEIHHYSLNFDQASSTRKFSRLRVTPKNGRKFSGSKVSLTIDENRDHFIHWITHFCQKMAILKIPNVVIELLLEEDNSLGSRCNQLVCSKDGLFLPHSMLFIERLASGLEDYVMKHGQVVDKERKFTVGRGVASRTKSARRSQQTLEVVILITEGYESSNSSCARDSAKTTEVLYFQDFSPWSIPQSSLNVLSAIEWQCYGFSLISSDVDEGGRAILKWEHLPQSTFIYIALHNYHSEVWAPQIHKTTKYDRYLMKKAFKIALDDLKEKNTGRFISQNSLKIQARAPDLSRAIAGLILSSNDQEFRCECASLLGLQDGDVHGGMLESCLHQKINRVIELNDRKPKDVNEHPYHLFEKNATQDGEYEAEEDGDENV